MSLQLLPRLAQNGDEEEMQAVWDAAGKGQWGTLLKVAPLALSKIGLCYLAASRKEAALIMLPNKAGKLQYSHVRANLIMCSDLGREAFREAEMQMRRIQISARQACETRGTLNKLIRALDDENLAAKLAGHYVSQLQGFAQESKDGAARTKRKFDDWDAYTKEFYRACDESKDDNEIRLDDTERQHREKVTIKEEAKAELREVVKEKREAAAEKEKRDKELEAALKGLKPNWKDALLSGAEEVCDFVHHGIDAFSTILGGAGNRSYQPLTAGPQPAPVMPRPESAYNFDPAGILLAVPAKTNFRVLTEELPKEGDSDSINAYCRAANECVNFMEQMLQDPQIAFAGSDPTVAGVLQCYREAVQAAKEIAELGGDNDGSAIVDGDGDSDNDSAKKSAKKWDPKKAKAAQGRLQQAYSKYGRLSVQANRATKTRATTSFASSCHGGGSGFASRRMAAKAINFDMAKQKHEEVGARQRELEEENRRLQQDIRRAEKDINELMRKCKTLKGIREVLKECLEALGSLKVQIDSLQTFFKNLKLLVEKELSRKVENFSKEHAIYATGTTVSLNSRPFHLPLADLAVKGGITSAKAHMKADWQREDLKTEAKALLLWFAAAFELATLYVEVSAQHIMPNIQKLDELATLAGSNNMGLAQSTAATIHTHLVSTQSQIQAMADKRCNDMMNVLVVGRGRENA